MVPTLLGILVGLFITDHIFDGNRSSNVVDEINAQLEADRQRMEFRREWDKLHSGDKEAEEGKEPTPEPPEIKWRRGEYGSVIFPVDKEDKDAPL